MPPSGIVSETPSELVRLASEIGGMEPATCPKMPAMSGVSPPAIVAGSSSSSSELETTPLAAVTVPSVGTISPFGLVEVTAVDRLIGIVRSTVKVKTLTKRSSLHT